MNTKSQTIKQVKQDSPSSFVVEQKEKMDTSAEVTMSDIAKKLRSVYAQMQIKNVPRPVTAQSFVEESLKSYLDDISRAILAEHYIRRQKEKKLFEYLEQIKTLVQSLQKEKNSVEEAMATRRIARSKSLDSVVQKLANMAGEGDKERSLLQETPSGSKQNSITASQTNFENVLQQGNKNALPNDTITPFSKEVEELVGHSTGEERTSDVQASDLCIEDGCTHSLNLNLQKTFFSSLKSFFWCFLIIAFMTAITLCFYGFLKGTVSFHFD
ncbi:hypothetical protein [Bartonella sp. ML70XJBT.G]|uniref:hypothetical protein n=1 Tax=Bartonella sp. ML70XJBT.G TaxID=3019093 RepID=UPI0023600328|nr:hypothetical protein [Bartonella sp. ML70XJBT.G]